MDMDFSSYNMIKWIKRTYAIDQKIYRYEYLFVSK